MTREEHLNRAEELLDRAERSVAVPGNASHASSLAQIAQAHVGLALAMPEEGA